MMRLALIGTGRWGKNIRRTLENIPDLEVIARDKGDDSSPAAPQLHGMHGVLIATPGSTHAAIALPWIKRGIPVFVEKPMTTSLKDALMLQQAAQKAKSIVFVGHIHRYNPAYLKAKEILRTLGNIRHIMFEGMNWGPTRTDMSAWWDWAPHDVALALDLLESKPKTVQAWGNFEITVAKLEFAPSLPVFITVTWRSPEKRKKMTAAGDDYAVVFDDTAQKKVAVYRDTTVTHPEYDPSMPLTLELEAFTTAIKTRRQPLTDINHGVDVVRILAAADQSMHHNGKPIILQKS